MYNKLQFPELNMKEIKKIIKEEFLRRKRHQLNGAGQAAQKHHSIYQESLGESYIKKLIPGVYRAAPYYNNSSAQDELENKQSYAVADFLNFHDEQFVTIAYRHILGREPDVHGHAYYVGRLRAGTLNKIEILGRIRYSPEGRCRAKRVRGLLWLFGLNLLYKIPVVGYLIRLAVGLLQIPTILANITKMEAYTHWKFTQEKATVNQVQDIVNGLVQTKADNAALSKLAENLQYLETNKADKDQLTEVNTNIIRLNLTKADREYGEELCKRIAHLEAVQVNLRNCIDMLDQTKANSDLVNRLRQQIGPLEWQEIQLQLEALQKRIADHMQNILNNQRNITLLFEDTRKILEQPLAADQIINLLSKEEHILDDLLSSFLNVFRGSREEIKERQSVYLPIIQEVCNEIEDAQVLDLGCGRGEWLELLKERQLNGIGIDFNSVLVKDCSDRNLHVIEAEALHYLRQLPPDSVAAITCFHIIEHMPLLMIIKIFDEALRVLKMGGVVIFETPNPENLLVGSCNFYLDPTHHHPIPPELAKYLLTSRGFSRVEIKRLHPYQESSKITGAETELVNRLNDLLYGFQDYAVIGYKW